MTGSTAAEAITGNLSVHFLAREGGQGLTRRHSGGDCARMNDAPSLYERLGGHAGILNLLKPFYADVRQDAVIGPIFIAHITDWNSHLAKVTEFWALQTGGPSAYRGGFAGAHLPIGLRPEHFQQWLGLWEWNSTRHLPPREAQEMIALAHEFGRRLRTVTQRASAFSLRATTFPKSDPSPGRASPEAEKH